MDEVERYRKALEEIADMSDSDYQGGRTHQCVAGQAIGRPKCDWVDYCEVCHPDGVTAFKAKQREEQVKWAVIHRNAGVTDNWTGFARSDDLDRSTLACPCGSMFTWQAFHPGLIAWGRAHLKHTENG